ncbi:CRISPR-associated helicase Cas3' [Trueperella pecoris]|uniref:CRISPR-associated helicase Cas3 n=1 Tax=Trueperella pecoris TaxID=2733571 RepID=A0A7M1R0M1_9ACTO|nr:CRISPR-associated helicase Cas3' [Trueperella pecoris]QOR47683.1 CRISPR-associated helicase Cas3' [Trueperella pecoris]
MRCHESVWAKLDGENGLYPLLAHLLDAAAVASALFDSWLRPELQVLLRDALTPGEEVEDARALVALMVGSHDVGKASPIFQYQPHKGGRDIELAREHIALAEGLTFGDPQKITKKANEPDYRRHERVGAAFLQGGVFDPNLSASRYWRILPSLGHHGRFVVPGSDIARPAARRRYREYTTGAPWSDIRQDLLDSLCEGTGRTFPDEDSRVGTTATILLSGLTVLADRIASQGEFVAAGLVAMGRGELELSEPRAWIERRRREAVSYVERTVGIYRGWESKEAARHAILGEYEPRSIQRIAQDSGHGLLNVMTPTGGGKTEAAMLRHAAVDERLIFLLPTQATSNALMRRIQKYYAGTSNVAALAHGLASVEDFYAKPVTVASDSSDRLRYSDNGGLYPTDFVRSRSSRLLAPVCVGTVDQALMGVLPRKWTHLRLLALANAHVVIDEVHTLDQYQTELLRPIVSWLRATKARVTFLTATMPSWQRETLLAYYRAEPPLEGAEFPAIEHVDLEGEVTRVRPESAGSVLDLTLSEEFAGQINDAHVTWAQDMHRRFPKARIGIICNRVDNARTVAGELAKVGPTILLHSRMTAEHRRRNAQLLEELLGPAGVGEAVFVVGTQAIEASLDIDLDLLRTELAPAPSLIQRAGRAWRRVDVRRSERIPGVERLPLHIVKIEGDENDPSYAGNVLPYMAGELARVWRWLGVHKSLQVPHDCQEFIDASAFSFADIDPESDASLSEAAKAFLHKNAGKMARVDLDEILNHEPTLAMFLGITGAKDADDGLANGTRLTEGSERRMLICVGDPEKVPGAWAGTVESLIEIRGSDAESVRRALLGSMPVAEGKLKDMEEDLYPLAEAKSVLAGYWALTNAEKYYDSAGFTSR